MKCEEKSIARETSLVFYSFLNPRFIWFVSFVLVSCLLFIGCSVSLNDRDDTDNTNVTHIEGQKEIQPLNQTSLPKEVSPRVQMFSGDLASMPVKALAPLSSSDLIASLQQMGLWGPKLDTQVQPLLVDSFPADLATLDVKSKKRVFFHTLLPVVMIAVEEIRSEREQLQSILTKFDCDPAQVYFSNEDSSWQEKLSDHEVQTVQALTRKYRHKNGGQLLERIDIVPVSLVLAQGAIESSWGTSRFAHLGNNLFGMWTWGGKGIVPLEREEGRNHKVAAYNSIIDSVRAYMLTINRLPAYKHLRELRAQTADPILLTQGLLNYSERREAYVDDLQKIISYNQLDAFDGYSLASI